MIIIASIQHFCTWFTIDLLKTAHPTPKFEELHKVDESALYNYDLLHTHIGTVSSSEGICEADKVKHMLPLHVRMISDNYKIIIPLRDPIEAVITRQARHPDLSHIHLLEAFEFITTIDSVYFFPVDTERAVTDKYHYTALLFKHANLTMTSETEEYVGRWEAPAYNKLNCKANPHAYNLKQAYKESDWHYLNKYLNEELRYVRKHKQQLMAFLKRYGYVDLPWFDDKF